MKSCQSNRPIVCEYTHLMPASSWDPREKRLWSEPKNSILINKVSLHSAYERQQLIHSKIIMLIIQTVEFWADWRHQYGFFGLNRRRFSRGVTRKAPGARRLFLQANTDRFRFAKIIDFDFLGLDSIKLILFSNFDKFDDHFLTKKHKVHRVRWANLSNFQSLKN